MKTRTKSAFLEDILPNLETKHKAADGTVDLKALEAEIKSTYNLTDDDGKTPWEPDFIKRSNAVAGTSALDIKAITDTIAKGFEANARSLDSFAGRITGGNVRNDDEGKWGFKSMGEYLGAVRTAGDKARRNIDERLMKGWTNKAAPSSYAAEAVGSDGGFLVPPDFNAMILTDMWENDNLLSRIRKLQTGSNNLTLPSDETTPWQTTGGIQSYWSGEAATIPQSKPLLKQVNLRLNKLTVLVGASDENLEDASLLSSYIPRKSAEKMRFKMSLAIFNGNGSGQPLGFAGTNVLTSSAVALAGGTVIQTKESGQTAGTIVTANIVNMMARLLPEDYSKAIWMINPNCWPQLLTLTSVGGTYPVYIPSTVSIKENPFGALFGRPVIPTQYNETLGTVGDIALVVPENYLAIEKTEGINAQVSTQFWFDQDMTAFRFTYRFDGQPWRSTTITPRAAGAPVLSNMCVLLQTRS